MAELPGGQDDLAAVVSFVRDEVRHYVTKIKREVAPGVSLRRRDFASGGQPELKKGFHPGAAPLQRGHELRRCHAMVIDANRRLDAMLPAQRLDPHAPGIVNVSGDGAHRTLPYPRNRLVPERRRQPLNELHGDAVVGPPRGEQACSRIGLQSHAEPQPNIARADSRSGWPDGGRLQIARMQIEGLQIEGAGPAVLNLQSAIVNLQSSTATGRDSKIPALAKVRVGWVPSGNEWPTSGFDYSALTPQLLVGGCG